ANKPKVESIDGLGPTIAIEQRKGSMNPRSTVATVTEIYDYLRVLFARVGKAHCPHCKKSIHKQTSSQIVDRLLHTKHKKFSVLAPLVRGRKGEHKELLEMAAKEGFSRIKVDGEVYFSDDDLPVLNIKTKHSIAVVIDRFVSKDIERPRLAASVETALKLGKNSLILDSGEDEEFISASFACPDCDFSFGEIEPRNFSFNSPFGACNDCHGLGTEMVIDENLLIPNPEMSLDDGALANAMKLSHFMWLKFPSQIDRTLKAHKISTSTPFEKLSKKAKTVLLYGDQSAGTRGSFPGIISELEHKFHTADSESTKSRIHRFLSAKPCTSCEGFRLKNEMKYITVAKLNIYDVTKLPIGSALDFFLNIKLNKEDLIVAKEVIKEVSSRLSFMKQVGLHYLTLNRTSGTLSGGEAQRIRLASQIGSKLVGVIYVLDEPSIGLHQRDNLKLIQSLMDLKELGNTVIVVEHDEETIRHADRLIDIGPWAGEHGGHVVANDTPANIIKKGQTQTAQYLSGAKSITIPSKRRRGKKGKLCLSGASTNNLQNVKLQIPLGIFVAITGVSGSGKSSLINKTLYPAIQKSLARVSVRPGDYKKLTGIESIDKVIDIDQSPIGKTTRSNPATYVKILDPIRKLYAMLPIAKARGYKPGRFSFNVKGGRCEACEGQGTKIIEMHFLADVAVTCDVCKGKRFTPETLEVHYKGKSIFDILELTVEDAAELFKDHPAILPGLHTLMQVGLGYLKLGQSSTTLSGGESQRIKLAAELSKRSTGNTFYILDEPTTGLHFEDINKLISVLNQLVAGGNTVLVIEHNLDVIKVADYIVDMGPEGGYEGGHIIAQGTPEQVSRNKKSYTGQYLKDILN
ncbi:MAG: excinuclease ABC subunit UvrA, partial [Planctomycetes bacterium]|nr:excinuclease ABC subunit UvrA [Planctomycetota bacterium]